VQGVDQRYDRGEACKVRQEEQEDHDVGAEPERVRGLLRLPRRQDLHQLLEPLALPEVSLPARQTQCFC
jgi:hypothetical protein